MSREWGAALVFVTIVTVAVATFISFAFAQSDAEDSAVALVGYALSDAGTDPGWDKDVAWCTGELVDTDDDLLYDHFEFSIHNGYPGYECQVRLTVMNAGENTFDITAIEIVPYDSTPSVTGDVTVTKYQPALPYTLDADETVDVVFSLYIEQTAAQQAQYSIEGYIDVQGPTA